VLIPLLVREQGKPLSEATWEVEGICRLLTKAAEITLPEEVYSEAPDRKIVTVRKPVGVVAGENSVPCA
jgi:acyl-CoA reductase-like NAD-dependent aldehyde dehydrogenase